jgi:hypothetical protein
MLPRPQGHGVGVPAFAGTTSPTLLARFNEFADPEIDHTIMITR